MPQVVNPLLNEDKPLSEVTAMVVDGGSFVELARRLGKTFKKVYYCVPSWATAFPILNAAIIGEGFDEIEVVDSPFRHFDEVELFIFPDVYHGPLQVHLAALGKRVWGSKLAEEFEIDRDLIKELMNDLGLPVGQYESIRGMAKLREYLLTHRDKFVKVDGRYRGHGETFYARDYTTVEPMLDDMAYALGPYRDLIDFTVEEPLRHKIELGVDGYCVDGTFPDVISYGLEIKDKSYVTSFRTYMEVPEPITRFDQTIAPALKQKNYRGFYSTEIRIGKDHKPYMLDFCARAGSPPNELYQEVFLNIPDIIYHGSGGKLINPICRAKYGAQIVMLSTWAEEHWLPVTFPEQYGDFIKLRNSVKIHNQIYVVPQLPVGIMEFGSAIGFGDTLQDAIAMAKEVAGSVTGLYIDTPVDALDEAEEELAKAEAMGLGVAKI